MCARRWVFATAHTSSTRARYWLQAGQTTSSPMNRCVVCIWVNISACRSMKQSLQLRTSQHLALTPQLQQSIRLLQLSTLELHQELEQLLTDNPLLERLDDPLDHTLRLLGDGAIQNSAPGDGAPEGPPQGDAPASSSSEEAPFDQPADTETSSAEADVDWSDAGRSKAPDDEDARPQLEASACTLREHLMEQMRVTLHEARDRAL